MFTDMYNNVNISVLITMATANTYMENAHHTYDSLCTQQICHLSNGTGIYIVTIYSYSSPVKCS